MKWFWALAAVLACSFAAAPASAATIRGRALRPDGSPAAGAVVVAQEPIEDTDCLDIAPLLEGRADAEGRFEIETPDAGAYNLRLEAPGCAARTLHEVRPGVLDDIRLARGVLRRGHVRDIASGGALEGATVCDDGGDAPDASPRWTLADPATGEPRVSCATTDRAGAFELRAATGGRHRFAIVAPAHQRTEIVLEFAEGASDDIEFRLAPGMEIEGRVVDQQGQPVSSARVAVPNLASALTDRDGRFILRGLPFAAVDVEVHHSSLSASYRHWEPESGRGAPMRVVLEPAASFRVRLETAGKPYEGRAKVADVLGRVRSARVRGGVLELAGLGHGDYASEFVVVPDEAPPFRVSGVLSRGETRDFGVATLDAGAPVAGRVVDEEGDPVSGAVLAVACRSGEAEMARIVAAGKDGAFVARALPKGAQCRVRSVDDRFLVAQFGGAAEASTDVVLPGGLPLALRLARSRSVAFRLVVGTPPRPVPFAAAKVGLCVADELREGGPREARGSDAAGRVVASGFAGGRRRFTLAVPGFLPRELPAFDARADATVDLGDVALTPGLVAPVRVVEPLTQTPIEGARVTVRDDPRSRSFCVTDSHGVCSLFALPPGPVLLEVQAAGYPERRIPVRLTTDALQPEVELSLPLGGALQVAAEDDEGKPLRKAAVVVWRRGKPGEFSIAQGGLDPEEGEGDIRLEDVPAGRVVVWLEDPARGRTLVQTATVAPGATTSVRFARRAPIRATVRVVRSGQPLDCRLVLTDAREEAWNASPAGPGQFSAEMSAPGRFTAHVSRPVTLPVSPQPEGEDSGEASHGAVQPEVQDVMLDFPIEISDAGDNAAGIDIPRGGVAGIVRYHGWYNPFGGAPRVIALPDGERAPESPSRASSEIDKDGRYVLDGLGPGRWAIRYELPDGVQFRTVTIRDGDEPVRLDVEFQQPVELKLRVRGDAEGPVSLLRVEGPSVDDDSKILAPDGDGLMTVRHAPGPSDIMVLARGYALAFITAPPNAGGPPLDVTLEPGAALHARVFARDGSLPEDVDFRLRAADGRDYVELLSNFDLEQPEGVLELSIGELSTGVLPAGAYTLEAVRGDQVVASRSVSTTAGQTTEVTLTVP